ncbi:MAG TPA: hypothetical protein VLG36_04255 [Candidatus Chromulinivoraceae bacterium]|nr:hypothetical protein [Candidatus Chromulinivoraceae bacterium]
MDTSTYQISNFIGRISNWRSPRFVRDQEISRREALELDAEVVSGDYFVTVATKLDDISRDTESYELKIKLEDIVSDLIYLQDNFRIIKNEQSEQ